VVVVARNEKQQLFVEEEEGREEGVGVSLPRLWYVGWSRFGRERKFDSSILPPFLPPSLPPFLLLPMLLSSSQVRLRQPHVV